MPRFNPARLRLTSPYNPLAIPTAYGGGDSGASFSLGSRETSAGAADHPTMIPVTRPNRNATTIKAVTASMTYTPFIALVPLMVGISARGSPP
jgi:hypothetical protein